MAEKQDYSVSAAEDGMTLGAVLRKFGGLSWGEAKKAILGRRVEVNGNLSLNDARRVTAGETVALLAQSAAPVPREAAVRILHLDPDIVVVDKPAGVVTVRHRDEDGLSDERKELQPTLEELVERLLPGGSSPRVRKSRRGKPTAPPLFVVHRLDRDTSGLMLFALTPRARDALVDMFTRHVVRRKYTTVVHGHVPGPARYESWIVRDRGDGLRGSVPNEVEGSKRAVTHVRPIEHVGDRYTIAECELETGRTHQIRIHLSEAGHMLCGEKLYKAPRAGEGERVDDSGAPRQALHSTELRLKHPIGGRELAFTSPLPKDLAGWLSRLKAGGK